MTKRSVSRAPKKPAKTITRERLLGLLSELPWPLPAACAGADKESDTALGFAHAALGLAAIALASDGLSDPHRKVVKAALDGMNPMSAKKKSLCLELGDQIRDRLESAQGDVIAGGAPNMGSRAESTLEALYSLRGALLSLAELRGYLVDDDPDDARETETAVAS